MSREWTESARSHAIYWDELSEEYLDQTRISLSEVHYGPLLPGENELGLLPCSLQGAECLELGCGAGQNSIVMAKAGAICTALDVSEAMLNQGRRLAEQAGVEINFLHGDLDTLPGFQPGSFDLIHSAYGIPFSSDPETLIRNCAALLKPGGTLLFSMGHPVYAGEWLDLEGEQGLFLSSYFNPTPDVRDGGESGALSRAFPVSEVAEWIVRAGLRLERILEPAALPAPRLQEAPYFSEAWAEQAEELRRFPIVVIFKATLP